MFEHYQRKELRCDSQNVLIIHSDLAMVVADRSVIRRLLLIQI